MPFKSTKALSSASSEPRELNYQGTYICPVCRHGEITGLTLMDAFACNFCRHIFTANLRNQSLQVVDSAQPMSWRWNGKNWQAAHRDDPSLTTVLWLLGSVLVTLPAVLVWLPFHIFPPQPGSRFAWLPGAWVGLTLGLHLLMVSWLLAEHYQLPLYVASRIRIMQWLGRR